MPPLAAPAEPNRVKGGGNIKYLKSHLYYHPHLYHSPVKGEETQVLGIILRSPAGGGATKNLSVNGFGEILRYAQNDISQFPDGH